MYTCTPRLCSGLPAVPLVAAVHHLQAGFPMACILKMLLSVTVTQRRAAGSVLKVFLAKLSLVAFCLGVIKGIPPGSFTGSALQSASPKLVIEAYCSPNWQNSWLCEEVDQHSPAARNS